jgi:hypothetical protein
MLKEVLRSISEGCTSVRQIAEKLDMQESTVEHTLRILKNQGYLSPDLDACPKGMPVCRNCPIAKDKPNIGVSLCITEKGMRYLKKN